MSTPAPSDTEFSLFATLIEREAGIHLSPAKKALLTSRLLTRLRLLGMKTFGAYYRHVVHEDREELVQLLDCICTNETHFFREPHHFEFLERTAVARWKRDAAEGRREKRLRVWSAGCSSGEEPYSLAMCLGHLLPASEGWTVDIVATDLSTRILARARAGIYPEERLKDVPLAVRHRCFLRGTNTQLGKVKIAPEVAQLVRFERLNLTDDTYDVPTGLDVVLCRNVLIYFQAELRKKVMARLCNHLAVGGYFLLGHAESLAPSALPVRTCLPTIYQKVPK